MSKRLSLLLILTLLSTLTASAQIFYNDIYYYINDKTKTAEVTSGRYDGVKKIEKKVYDKGIEYKVISIRESAFYNCKNLKEVNIPVGVVTIGTSAFNGCTSLPSVTIPDGVSIIDRGTFQGCSALTSVTIPNTVIEIGVSAFQDCSALPTVPIPVSVGKIRGGAFSHCTSLNKIEIPNGVDSINANTFSCCTALEHVKIGSGVKYIGASAFEYCTSLPEINIPSSVIKIEGNAFANCSILTKVRCYAEKIPETSGYPFNPKLIANATLYVPERSVGAYKNAEFWKLFKNIEPIKRGDLNGNRKIDMTDATTIANAHLGTEYATEVADLNNDGKINMSNIMFTVNYINNGKFPDDTTDKSDYNNHFD